MSTEIAIGSEVMMDGERYIVRDILRSRNRSLSITATNTLTGEWASFPPSQCTLVVKDSTWDSVPRITL